MTRLDPESASEAARKLTGVGMALETAWKEARAEITRLNGAQPWGTDDPGKAFDDNYSKGSSDESPAKLALKAGDELVAKVKELGPLVQQAIGGTIAADEFTAKLFKKAGGSKA
jgi:hypothetical protein